MRARAAPRRSAGSPRRPAVLVLSLALLALSLLVLAPASAQLPASPREATLEVSVTNPRGAVPAGAGDARVPYEVTYRLSGPGHGRIAVDLAVREVAGWTVTVDPPRHEFEIAPGLSFEKRLQGTVTIAAGADVPALRETPFTMDAASSGNEVAPPARGAGEFAAKAAWRPGLQVRIADPTVVVADGGGNALALGEVLVTGNGPVRVIPSTERSPDGCGARPDGGGWLLDPGARLGVRIKVECDPGWARGEILVRFDHALALPEGGMGSPVEASWSARRAGDPPAGGARAYGDEPRESPAAAAGALVLLAFAAAAARRR